MTEQATKTGTTPNNTAAKTPALKTATPSKLDTIEKLLRRKQGATIAEMVKATGWQQHSVRGAMAGSLKKRGLAITSEKAEGTRRYPIAEAE